MSRRVALTIGNFDGVHLGHRALVAETRRAAGEHGSVIALTFDPPPATVLRPTRPVAMLSAFPQRQQWLREAGADEVIRLEPTRERLEQTPEQFLEEVVARHRPDEIVEGTDFRFGRDRRGDLDTLRRHESRLGYRTRVVAPVESTLADQSIVVVGSTLIRWLLRAGRVGDAARLLGRPHVMMAEVVCGDRRGRTIGVPTANLTPSPIMPPGDGIYAGRAGGPDGASYPAAISVGTKPTFGGHERVTEAHLIGYRGPVDDYGWTIRLEFHRWLRGQVRYDSAAALVEQLRRDLVAVERLAVV